MDFHPSSVDARMYMIRAKFLAIRGALLATEQPQEVHETLQILDNVVKAAIDAYRSGRILAVTATMYEPQTWEAIPDVDEPIETPETHLDLDPKAGDYPF
jgi:hypothetical protein